MTLCTQSQSSLLSLPPELTLLILRHLPLSALFIWHFQLCKRLRLDACDHPSSSGYGLELRNGYWSLAEHRQAAREVRVLCSPNVAQAQHHQQQQPKASSAFVKDGPETSPDADARLAVRALRYIGLVAPTPIDTSLPLPLPRLSRPPTSLSLIASRGVDGRLLKQLLREPRLFSVETVVKTGRIDEPIHEVWAPASDLSRRSNPESRLSMKLLSDTTSSWALGLGVGGGGLHAPVNEDEENCALPQTAQAVCVAGSRLHKGETIRRGQGIQMGFEALCFASPSATSRRAALHIILEGAYDLDAAMEMERLFAFSRLQCRQCGNVIEFG